MTGNHGKQNNEWAKVPIFAILLFQLAALIARSAINVQLRDNGYDPLLAEDLSYLVVPPLFLLFMVPVWKQHGKLIRGLFKRNDLTWRASGTGLSLALVIWFAVLLTDVALTAYEINTQSSSLRRVRLEVEWLCGHYLQVILGVVVTALIIPVIEEAVNRGFVLHFFLQRGKVFAILLSAILFAILHQPESLPFTFVAGIFFAYLTLHHSTLWPATIAHSAYNLLVQMNESCMTITWARSSTAPAAATASIVATIAVFVLLALGAYLVSPKRAGPQ